VSQLRTNAVLRWEYRPGSTLFLVWAHGREAGCPVPQQCALGAESTRRWSRAYRDLLDEHPDNTFLIKVAYWLNR
jgi:hypothetical protein